MIFISHNYNDKPIVEPIAVRLAEVFGQDKVFYDSWSIQPGDGIIDKMNSGLMECKFFFLFISKNSIESKMVTLEWQNALMQMTQGKMRIIPVRLDASLIPTILLQTLYLDLFTNGLETTVRQMIDITMGISTFRINQSNFSNLKATGEYDEKKVSVIIQAMYFMEPISQFLFLLDNKQEDIQIAIDRPAYNSGFIPEVALDNGVKGNAWVIGWAEATVPNFPQKIEITSKTKVNLLTILHQEKQNYWTPFNTEIKKRNI